MSEKLLRLLFTHKCRGTTCRWFGGMLLTYLSTYKQNSKILIFHSHPTTYVMMSYGAVLTGARFICSVPYLFHRGSSAWPPYNTISVVISSWLDLKIKQLPQCDDEMFAFGTTFILTSKHICKKWMNDKILDFPKIPTQKIPRGWWEDWGLELEGSHASENLQFCSTTPPGT